MLSVEWMLVAILAFTTIVFAVLWLSARRKSGSTDGVLASDKENTLLGIGEVDLGGVKHQYGVVSAKGSHPTAFLIAQNMGHLQVGDVFTMRNGQAYKVESRGAAPKPAREPEPTVVPAMTDHNNDVDNRTILYTGPGLDGEEPLPDLASAFPFLNVVEGPDAGEHFPLPYADSGVGRSEDNVVGLSDDGASRQHCAIDFSGTDFILRDLDSTNGTYCNGEPIEQCTLDFGDRIEVADSVMIFTSKGFEARDSDPDEAIQAFEQCLEVEADFLPALKNLAFLLERDIRRKKDAAPLWKKIGRLEKSR